MNNVHAFDLTSNTSHVLANPLKSYLHYCSIVVILLTKFVNSISICDSGGHIDFHCGFVPVLKHYLSLNAIPFAFFLFSLINKLKDLRTSIRVSRYRHSIFNHNNLVCFFVFEILNTCTINRSLRSE